MNPRFAQRGDGVCTPRQTIPHYLLILRYAGFTILTDPNILHSGDHFDRIVGEKLDHSLPIVTTQHSGRQVSKTKLRTWITAIPTGSKRLGLGSRWSVTTGNEVKTNDTDDNHADKRDPNEDCSSLERGT